MIDLSSKFLIVGLGLIGGSYAKGLKARGYTVYAIDHNEASISYALGHGVIDQGSALADSALIHQADIIIMALYPTTTIDWLREHQDHIKANTYITDVCGVKETVISSIQEFLRTDLEFIAAHPMAGKEVSGVSYSDEKIFLPANFIITPTSQNTKQAIALVQDLANILRFERISILSPKEHDEMIGFLSQLTHVIAVCLMNTHESDHLVDYTGDSFRDLTRIAKINENLWSELFFLNKQILLHEMRSFMDEMERFYTILEQNDIEHMKALFRQSTIRRKKFDR